MDSIEILHVLPFFTKFPNNKVSLKKLLQRVHALRAFWDLEKTILHEICVSGTVLQSPTTMKISTYMYMSQKSC